MPSNHSPRSADRLVMREVISVSDPSVGRRGRLDRAWRRWLGRGALAQASNAVVGEADERRVLGEPEVGVGLEADALSDLGHDLGDQVPCAPGGEGHDH